MFDVVRTAVNGGKEQAAELIESLRRRAGVTEDRSSVVIASDDDLQAFLARRR